MLTPVPGQDLPSSGSNKLIYFDCDCGRKNIQKDWSSYVRGKLTRCGSCNLMPASYWEKEKFGKLRMKFPQEYSKGTLKRVTWICDCGKEVDTPIAHVTRGNSNSCGKCNLLPAEYFANNKFGKLKIKEPKEYNKGSTQKITWICDCGKETNASIYYVVKGLTKSCGKCNLLSAEYWRDTKFGKIKMKEPKDFHKGSTKNTTWICDCGNEFETIIGYVTSGDTKSCGKCNVIKKEELQTLKSKDKEPTEPTKHIKIEKTYDVKAKLTCGCSNNGVSFAQREIFEFIKSCGVEAELEYSLNQYKYDIFVPSFNLLIEYNGLKWHSMPNSKQNDTEKYKMAVKNGFDYLMIYEDEWVENQHKVENLIKNKFRLQIPISIRPSKCEIKKIPFYKADQFYDLHHYIGACKSPCNYGVFYQDELIGCISFKHPTRQSTHPWELIRMVSDPRFRVHGIWSKLLKQFINEYEPTSVVSFSDNRLFSGKVYEKIGFKFDGEIRPDYYWHRDQKRYHKSGLRKQKHEIESGKTETELRTAQGYERVWDLGKKRWVIKSDWHEIDLVIPTIL